MNVSIEIHYQAASKGLVQGSFPLHGQKPETVAHKWWKQLQRELSYHGQLEKVIINGDTDITELVRGVEKQRIKDIKDNWNLPF